jgi:hypothetical protein
VHPSPPAEQRPGLREAIAIWTLLGVVGAATFVTYARIEPDLLYNVSREGIAGGASRTLVYLNYPVALIALGVLPFAVDRLRRHRPGLVGALAAAAVPLCALVAVPGVVDPGDLDARPVNLLPALGVGIVVSLTVWAILRGGAGRIRERVRGDRLRFALAIVLVIAAVPWAFAEAGFYAPPPFLAEEVPPGETLAAVHLGRHHGMDGVLLALAALGLSRPLAGFRARRLAAVASGYLALMLSYGATIAAEDFWLEQVVKRGWTDLRLPDLLRPDLSPGWVAIVAAAIAIELAWFRPARRASA